MHGRGRSSIHHRNLHIRRVPQSIHGVSRQTRGRQEHGRPQHAAPFEVQLILQAVRQVWWRMVQSRVVVGGVGGGHRWVKAERVRHADGVLWPVRLEAAAAEEVLRPARQAAPHGGVLRTEQGRGRHFIGAR